MQIDFSGYERFMGFLSGQSPLETAWQHPAYVAIQAHAAQFSSDLAPVHVADALAGRESPFYGLHRVRENLPRIHALAEQIAREAHAWEASAAAELQRLLPAETLDSIRVYPTLGYDMGIGLNGVVCMNLNTPLYLEHPEEFFYFMIHECTHVLHGRTHLMPALTTLRTPQQWQAFFALMTQYEGFATYAPHRLRQQNGHLAHSDYQALADPAGQAHAIGAFLALDADLRQAEGWPTQEYLERIFGPERLTYRAGCALFHRIEATGGLAAVTEAFYLPEESFLSRFQLLSG